MGFLQMFVMRDPYRYELSSHASLRLALTKDSEDSFCVELFGLALPGSSHARMAPKEQDDRRILLFDIYVNGVLSFISNLFGLSTEITCTVARKT
jgi:hypothetical protein